MTFIKPCFLAPLWLTLKPHIPKVFKWMSCLCVSPVASGAPMRPQYQLLSVWYEFAVEWNYNTALCSAASQCLWWIGGLHCCGIGCQRACEWSKTQKLLYSDGFASSRVLWVGGGGGVLTPRSPVRRLIAPLRCSEPGLWPVLCRDCCSGFNSEH